MITILNVEVSIVAVVISALLYMIVSSIWYSPALFYKEWARLADVKVDTTKGMDAGDLLRTMGGTFILSLGLGVLLGALYQLVFQTGLYSEVVSGVVSGLIFAFVSTTFLYANYTFGHKPLKLWLIDLGNTTLSLVLMGIVFAVL